MEAFGTLTATAAVLSRDNVDTEVILPIRRLIGFPRGQLGAWCFEPWRYRADGSPEPGFPLNAPACQGAQILVTGANFGCGSSREAAVWALWDMGIRCIIAESFGDIFHANCFQNGLLTITLDEMSLGALREALRQTEPTVTVDLAAQSIRTVGGQTFAFAIAPERRVALLEGLDDIGLTLRLAPEIAGFEQADAARRPWAQHVESEVGPLTGPPSSK